GIQKVKDDQEALALMQDTDYGLTAAVFSSDYRRAQVLLEEMNTGTVYWNCCDRVSPNVPWSGRKQSGLGSSLSAVGIRAFVQPNAYHLRGQAGERSGVDEVPGPAERSKVVRIRGHRPRITNLEVVGYEVTDLA